VAGLALWRSHRKRLLVSEFHSLRGGFLSRRRQFSCRESNSVLIFGRGASAEGHLQSTRESPLDVSHRAGFRFGIFSSTGTLGRHAPVTTSAPFSGTPVRFNRQRARLRITQCLL
jgi:hypothetical protein